MKNILFLCNGNSCRSQIAEGWGEHFYSKAKKEKKYNFFSAGTMAKGVNPYAIKVMDELGIDISGQLSKTISELPPVKFDLVLSLCTHAHQTCPIFPGAKNIHLPFDDPPNLTAAAKSEEERLQVYRRVRDEIKKTIEGIEELLK